jgi:hypothetical protein
MALSAFELRFKEQMGERMAELNSRTVTYARAAIIFTMSATPGRTEVDVFDNTGASTRLKPVDWIVTTADLVTGGITDPKRGDTITSEGVVYQVAPVEGVDISSDVFAYTTAARDRTRIHTQVISE